MQEMSIDLVKELEKEMGYREWVDIMFTLHGVQIMEYRFSKEGFEEIKKIAEKHRLQIEISADYIPLDGRATSILVLMIYKPVWRMRGIRVWTRR